MIAMAVLGLILMLGVTARSASGYTAYAQVDGGPGGSVEAALDISSDVANRYVQTELVYIEILAPDFAKAMTDSGLPASSVTAIQQGTTNVVALGASGANPVQAAEKANIASGVYIADWRSRAEGDLRRLVENTDVRIQEIRNQSGALGSGPEDTAQRRGLEAELNRLTQEQSDLRFRIGGVRTVNRLVEPASPDKAVRSTPLLQASVLGLVAGVVLGLGYVAFTRVRRLSKPDSGD